jgi:hypothetical protein
MIAKLESVATAAATATTALSTSATATAAIAAAATSTTVTTAAAAEATAAALALLRDVDADLAAVELAAVELTNGVLRCLRVGHGHECKAARSAGFTVGRKRDLAHLAEGTERRFERGL